MVTINLDASVTQLLDASYRPSNEGKSKVLSSTEQHLQKEETGPNVDSELTSVINTLMKDRLPTEKTLEKMNKYLLP